MNPQQAQSQYEKATGLHQQGKLDKAISIYRKLIRAFPNLDGVLTNYGLALYQQGAYEPALKALRKAIKINPTNFDAYQNQAATLMALDRSEEAAEVYEFLAQGQPNNASLQYNYANLLYQLGRVTDAEMRFLQAIKAQPDLAQAHFNLGYLYLQDDRPEAAATAFRKAIAAKPDYVGAYFNLGNLEADQGRIEQARSNYEEALQHAPDYVPVLNALAKLESDLEQHEEALVWLERSLAVDGEQADTWVLQGNALSGLGKETEAKAAFERALALQPQHPIAQQNLDRSLRLRIPAWHFTMLADQERNRAYRKAIEGRIQGGERVLDIGTGSGLLAMMAARAGAAQVDAFEVQPDLAATAREVVDANGYSEQIQVWEKHSGLARVGEDLGEKAEVLISEILDAALIGEGVLASHRNALQELLVPGATVIPARAECFGCLIALPDLRPAWPIGSIEGFDLSGMGRFQQLNKTQMLRLDAENWQPLTEEVSFWQLNFADIPPAVQADAPLSWEIDLPASTEGSAHAFAFWFDLWLDDQTKVSSRPGGELKHWGQSVYYFAEDISVQSGMSIPLKVNRTDLNWWFG